VVPLDTNNEINDETYLVIKNHAWKSSSGAADFVIVCDCDELLHHEDFMAFLTRRKQEGFTVLSSTWCTMVSEEIPESDGLITDLVQYGRPYFPHFGEDHIVQKTIIFSPGDIQEINYEPGAHVCHPTGNVNALVGDVALKNLHYKWLSFNYVFERQKRYAARLSQKNIIHGWGVHYHLTKDELEKMFEDLKRDAIKVI
jgi:hypothetical protein